MTGVKKGTKRTRTAVSAQCVSAVTVRNWKLSIWSLDFGAKLKKIICFNTEISIGHTLPHV